MPAEKMFELIVWSMVLAAELIFVILIVVYEIDQFRRRRLKGGIPSSQVKAMIFPGIQAVFGVSR